jgi:cell wall-associated NlpC family hydrolase
MRSAARALRTGASLSLLLPTALAAQSRSTVELFVGQNEALLPSTALYGAGLTTGGPLGIRLSGALALGGAGTDASYDAGTASGVRGFAADADLVLSTDLLGGAILGGMGGVGARPYLFGGVGALGRQRWGAWERGPSLSYGAGTSLALGDVLALDGSARYRVPFADSSLWQSAFPRGWEYRVGLSFRLGGTTVSRTRRGSTTTRGSSRPTISWPSSSSAGARVIPTAEHYLGTPYVWGGETPRGFDCSGFTQYVFARHSIELPRTSREQARVGSPVSLAFSSFQPGDLLFFAENYSRIDHVAIYAGDDRIIHATSSGGEVRYDDLRSQRGQWFVDHMVAARRMTGDTRALIQSLRLFARLAPGDDGGDRAPRP